MCVDGNACRKHPHYLTLYSQRIKTNLLHNTPLYLQFNLKHVLARFIVPSSCSHMQWCFNLELSGVVTSVVPTTPWRRPKNLVETSWTLTTNKKEYCITSWSWFFVNIKGAWKMYNIKSFYIPYNLESSLHTFYSFRGLKIQMQIIIVCGLDSRSRAGFWKMIELLYVL
jgi:hypothetical protein